jgi:uncharacterized circularly permuted ATP-grasp superfamily protein
MPLLDCAYMQNIRIKKLILSVLHCSAFFIFAASAFAENQTHSQLQNDCVALLSGVGVKSHSYYPQKDISPVPNLGVIEQLQNIQKQSSPSFQHQMNTAVSADLEHSEMSFQVKNPKTGWYDKFNAVPVDTVVAPISKANFDKLVSSTQPLLVELRKLLQKIYSVPNFTVESLGLSDLSVDDRNLVLKIINESIYFEPALRAPNMSQYPFLSVTGFDGALGDPQNPVPQFYELNSGTPSGLSNNIQLLNSLSYRDPKVFSIIKNHLPMDDTFSLLKSTLESNAQAWTGQKGIIVAISPGIYNGAHPDVAMIANYANIPLVQTSDLYTDAHGDMRLNTGAGKVHPLVTGIYGRMEESYFLQSNDMGIPLISPTYHNNVELGKKLGLPLRNGVIYKFIQNDKGEVVDVERDKDGKPILQDVWCKIGSDPNRLDAPPGSFAKAVLDRRLYYSAIGGRVVDDKRLFRIFAERVMRKTGRSDLAQPVKSLARNEYAKFFANPDLFVVKEPENSGGVGINFLAFMNTQDRSQVIERVRQNPDNYEIQYVNEVTTLPLAHEVTENGITTWQNSNVATDARLFVYLDAAGRVHAGPNSILLRTAPLGSLYSNTSKGGGYGIAAVIDEENTSAKHVVRGTSTYEIPNSPELYTATIPASRIGDVTRARINATLLGDELADPKNLVSHKEKIQQLANQLSYDMRLIMDLLPQRDLWLIKYCRELSQQDKFDEVRSNDLSHWLVSFARNTVLNSATETEKPIATTDRLSQLVTVKMFEQPEITYTEKAFRKVELGEYTHVADTEIQKIIDEVKKAGGEVRLMRAQTLGDNNTVLGEISESPYFWMNMNPDSRSYLIPVIAIDLNGDRALAALKHEFEHFKMWKQFYDAARAEGLDHLSAILKSNERRLDNDMRVVGEKIAVEAEIRAEVEFPNSPFNQPNGRQRPIHFYQRGYINRMTYPQFVGVYDLILNARWNKSALDTVKIQKYLTDAIIFAKKTRQDAINYYDAQLAKDDIDPAAELNLLFLKKDLSQTTLLDLIIKPYGIERLIQNKMSYEFQGQFKQAEQTLNMGSDVETATAITPNMAESLLQISSSKITVDDYQQQ